LPNRCAGLLLGSAAIADELAEIEYKVSAELLALTVLDPGFRPSPRSGIWNGLYLMDVGEGSNHQGDDDADGGGTTTGPCGRHG